MIMYMIQVDNPTKINLGHVDIKSSSGTATTNDTYVLRMSHTCAGIASNGVSETVSP